MNTNDEKIQWHPAFDAALQIELGEETKYKADTETVDFIPAAELTITFVCYHYPRTMLQKLQRDRQITVGRYDHACELAGIKGGTKNV